ncbi:MAG: thiamine biosynthesis protein ThiS [Gammaproteobacteria bacterium]|jgi:thiamine biosynthesis protein ThiS
MQITVKLFGKLRHYMPVGNTTGKYPLMFDQGDTLEKLLEKMPLPQDKPFLVLHNDSKINKTDYASITVNENDDIIVLTPVKGG